MKFFGILVHFQNFDSNWVPKCQIRTIGKWIIYDSVNAVQSNDPYVYVADNSEQSIQQESYKR